MNIKAKISVDIDGQVKFEADMNLSKIRIIYLGDVIFDDDIDVLKKAINDKTKFIYNGIYKSVYNEMLNVAEHVEKVLSEA